MLGYIGLILLLIAYIYLYKGNQNKFYLIDTIASFFLCIYAITLKDIPFFIVNGIITIILFTKIKR